MKNHMTKDKVRGLFLGIAIGDALGMPVETFSVKKIKETYGRVDKYHRPDGHKWFNGEVAGSWTDDTQLTLAVAEAIIETGDINMDRQAAWHVKACESWTKGWGPSTKEAVLRLKEGTHWKESGNFAPVGEEGKLGVGTRGFGNGISMKCAPFAVLLAAGEKFDFKEVSDKLADFAAMTHRTSMGVSSGIAHTFATYRCLVSNPKDFDLGVWRETVITASKLGKNYFPETLVDDITGEFEKLKGVDAEWDDDKIREEFGRGVCYVYRSLPFTYAFFCRDYESIETVYDCVTAGGDTDSNGSMLAGLLGALHGTKIFPDHLIDGLDKKNEIIDVADRLSAKCGV